MNGKQALKRRIWELDFALHELVLYLDTHPASAKALELTKKYREKRKTAIEMYEEKYGAYCVTANKTEANGEWKWIKGPWPWENKFEGE